MFKFDFLRSYFGRLIISSDLVTSDVSGRDGCLFMLNRFVRGFLLEVMTGLAGLSVLKLSLCFRARQCFVFHYTAARLVELGKEVGSFGPMLGVLFGKSDFHCVS